MYRFGSWIPDSLTLRIFLLKRSVGQIPYVSEVNGLIEHRPVSLSLLGERGQSYPVYQRRTLLKSK